MKNLLLTGLISIFSVLSYGQTIGFTETFEPPSFADSVVSGGSPGHAPWSLNNRLARSGSWSDSSYVTQSDTSHLTTIPFSTVGNTNVFLHFSHICKIEFADAAEIFVSNNNGASWIKLTAAQYMGSGVFGAIADRFTSTSYIDWLPATASALPNNSWWRDEVFDISAFVANSPQVLIRFLLRDGNSNGAVGNAGWYLDDIKIIMSPSELIPPTITMVTPIVQDTIYQLGPYAIKSVITDASGIDTAYVVYTVNNGPADTIGMNILLADTFQAMIPFPGFGRTVHYRIVAVDGSPAANTAYYPSASGWLWFYPKFSTGGTFVIGTGTGTNANTGYPAPYGNWYWGAKHQFLIRASELQALGAPGGAIGSLAFNVQTAQGVPLQGFYISMGHTSLNNVSTTFQTNLTSVYATTTYTEVAGWNTHTFQTPFAWNGTDNLIVETCFNNSGYTYNAIMFNTTTPFQSSVFYNTDAATVCTNPSAFSTSAIRPNMQIEILGVSSLPLDIGVSELVHPTGGVLANQAFDVQVKLENYGTDTVSSATINWTLGGVAQTAYSWSGTLLPGDTTSPIIIGGLNLPLGSYALKVWSDMPNNTVDMNSANDSVALTFFACAAQLAGTYTIGGTGADFPDFTSAVTGLAQCGISAPVVFNVANGVYNEQITIPWISGSSPTNTVLFKSASGDSSAVTLRYTSNVTNNFTLRLDETKHIEFRQMTIEAVDTAHARAVVLSSRPEFVNFNGMVFKNSAVAPGAAKNLVHTNDSVAGSINFTGNLFQNGSTALLIAGNSTNRAPSVVVEANEFINQLVGGINMQNLQAPHLKANEINSVSTTANFRAVVANNCAGAMLIEKNKINASHSMGGYGVILMNCNANSSQASTIVNNFIRINSTTGGNNLWGGIVVQESKNQNIYYNNINMTGSFNNSCALILFDDPTSGSENLRIINNNLVNIATGYVVYTNNFDTSQFVSNYNNMITNGQFFSRFNNQNQVSFNAWQTATLKDANSMSVDPYYVSSADLHVTNNLLNGTAIPIPGVIDDIDGDLRDPNLPDIGADEFVPSPWDATMLAILSPVTGCGLDSAEVVTVMIKNIGSATISGNMTTSFRLGANAAVTESITSVLNPGDTIIHSFSTTIDLDVFVSGQDSTFKLSAWVDLLNDPVKANDSAFVDINSLYKPAPPTVTSPVSISYNTSTTLNAVSPNTIRWFDAEHGGNELHLGASFTTPVLYDTTVYYVEAVSSSLTQGSLTTSFSGTTNCGGGFMFDIEALGQTINLTGFGLKCHNTGSVPVAVYYKQGSYAGFGSNQAAWTLVGNYTVNSNGPATQTLLNLPAGVGISIPAGQTYGIYLQYHSQYGSGASTYQNSDLILRSGLAHCTNWDACCDPRDFNGAVYYEAGALGCESTRVPVQVNVINFPPNDAGIARIVNPATSVPSGVDQPITFRLKNYGTSTLTSVNINWTLNWTAQPVYNWTGNLAYKDSIDITVDTMNFNGGIYYLVAYTTMPNNVVDTVTSNDTSQVIFNACLSGTYTIGDTTGGAPFDFPNFNSAKAALDLAGVCGHVEFLVNAGTYTEQLEFSAILGAGENSTISFRSLSGDSTDVILQYASNTTTDNFVVRFSNASYINFEQMTIKATGVSFGRVVEYMNSAHRNNIRNCVIETSITSTSTNFAGIFSTSNAPSNYVVIENNLIRGGYYGIYWYGTSANRKKHFTASNNIIEAFHYYGIYTYYADSLFLISNQLTNRTTSAITYGMYLYYTNGYGEVDKNMLTLQGTSSQYGITVDWKPVTTPNPLVVSNNFIYQTGAAFTVYGIYLLGSNYVDVYHNSVNIAGGSLTGGRALYQSTGSNINIVNNIFNNSGPGYSYYVNTPTAISSSDYNNFHATGANFAYWTSPRANLAALQTASGQDANSHSILPPFIAPNNPVLTTTVLSSKGIYLPAVPDDIFGNPRGVLPTIGAFEMPLQPIDGGISTVLLPPSSTNEFDTIPVRVVVCNFGTDTLYTFNIGYSVNGGTPVIIQYNSVLLPAHCDTVYLPSFVSPAGSSTICAFTQVVGDTNTNNDQACKSFFGVPQNDAQLAYIMPLAEGCGLTTDTVIVRIRNLGATVINSNITARYQVVGGTAVVTQAVTQTIAVNDSILFAFNTPVDLSVIGSDSVFIIKAWVDYLGDNVKYNDTAATSTKSFHVPDPPIVSGDTIPYGAFTTLTAVSPTNDTLLWFSQAVGGTEIHQGSSYTTPILYVTDTLYVEARGGSPAAEVDIGTGTTANTSSSYPSPYGNYYWGARHQFLILASELNALGAEAGPVSSLAFNVQTAQGTPLQGFEIKMGHTTQSAMTNTFNPGLTNVYSTTSYTETSGWNVHAFQTPFIWNGTDNLIVETCFNNSSWTGNASVFNTTTPFQSTVYSNGDNATMCSNTTGILSSIRPNMRLMIEPTGCSSVRSPAIVVVGAMPPYDLGVKSIMVNEGCGLDQEAVSIKVYNQGADTLHGGATAAFRVNTSAWSTTETIPNTIAPGDTITYTFTALANLSTPADTFFRITAWVNHPLDINNQNDTLKRDSIESLYTPPAPIVSNVTVPYGSPATLTAVSSSGDTLLWYDQETGGNLLQQGPIYVTPIMYVSDTLWVEAMGGLPSAMVTVGTGTGANTNATWPAPYGNWYWGSKHQFLILASELSAIGAAAGQITSLAFDVQTVQGTALQGFEIKMGHSSQTSMTTNFLPGLTTVYSVPAYTETSGWNTHSFQNSFVWNGTDNVVVETCFNNSSYTYNATVYNTTTPFQSTVYTFGDNANVCSNASGTAVTARPNMQLMVESSGCSSERSPLIVTVGNPAPFDAGVYNIAAPTSAVNMGAQETVKVRVRNYGTNSISNFPVSYRVNNQAAVTETITATLASQDTLEYTFATPVNLSTPGMTYAFKAYTSLTNDNTALNDTTYKSVVNLIPNYCASGATSALYQEITNVTLNTMNNTSPANGAMYTDFTTTVPPTMLSPGVSYPISITSDFAPGATFQYDCWVKVFIDYNRDGVFDPVTEMAFSMSTTSSNTVTGTVTIPAGALVGNTMMRVVLNQTTSESAVTPCGTYLRGETEDYTVAIAPQAACDAGVIQIISPAALSVAGSSQPVWVKFMNFGSNPIAANTLSVACELNGGTPVVVAYTGSLAPLHIDSVQLPNVVLAQGVNNLCAYTILACDSNTFNNEICKAVFGQFQTYLPFSDNFDQANNWYNATPLVWERGTPAGTTINTAHSAPNVWMTKLSTDYPNNANAYLYSPRFDFSMLTANDTAVLSFWHRMHSQLNNDGAMIQRSVDGGTSWASIGYMSDPEGINWYNSNVDGSHCWTGNIPWTKVSYKLSPGTYNQSNPVQFRFRFFSNAAINNFDGWAIDDFEITIPQAANDVGVVEIIAPGASSVIGSQQTVTIRVANFGTQPQISVPVRYRINNNTPVQATLAAPLQPLDTVTFTFPTTYTSPATSYKICAYTALTSDNYRHNDTLCKIVQTSPAALDLGVISITDISYHDTTYVNLPDYEVSILVVNFGTSTVHSFDVEYLINGVSRAIENVVRTMAPNDTHLVVFNTKYGSPMGIYDLCGRVILAGDANPANNETCITFIGKMNTVNEKAISGAFLGQNRPNPARDITVIDYSIPSAGKVVFQVFNLIGQPVYREEAVRSAGTHRVELNLNALPAGVYSYGIIYEGYRVSRQMVIVK